MPIATATTRERQRARDSTHGAKRAAVLDDLRGKDAPLRGDIEPPSNPNRLGPVHATGAYAAARREREETRARQKRIAAARAAAAERVTVIHHEPEPVELDPRGGSTLIGLDGRPLDAEQLVGPDGKPLQSGQSSIELPRDDAELLFDPLDDDLFDDDALEMDEQRRRESYGRYPRRSLELAHIIREFGQEYLAQARRDGVSPELLARQERVLRELMACRTSAMGEHAWSCGDCGQQYVLFNSCGNRHCGKCREHHRRQWAEKLELDLLPVEYHHLVLTLPRELTLLVMAHGDVLYNKVMRAAGMAILAVGKDMLDAQLAVQAMLHTWGQILNRHVHIHCLVPAGGLTYGKKGETREWVEFPEKGKFLSLEELSNTFRDLFLEELEKVHASGDVAGLARVQPKGQRNVHRSEALAASATRELESHSAFKRSLAPFRSTHWIVRHRAVWIPRGLENGRPYNSVVSYLARYANRVVIGNSRLEEIDGGDVLFRYKDYRDENTWKTKRMPGVEFLERFLHHMLPPGLHNKRRYGFWGYRVRTQNLALIRKQLGVPPVMTAANASDEEEQQEQQEGEKSRHCAVCKGELEHIGGTHRPSVPVILDMIWADMQKALDVLPESYRVRTYEDLYLEELNTLLAQRMEAQAAVAWDSVPGVGSDGARENSTATAMDRFSRAATRHMLGSDSQATSKQNQRRGPPPDQQGRLAFASL